MSITPDEARVLLEKISKLHILVVGDVMCWTTTSGATPRACSPEAPVPVVADIARDVGRGPPAAGQCRPQPSPRSAPTPPSPAALAMTMRERSLKADSLYEQNVQPIPIPNGGATIVKTRVMVQHQQLCPSRSRDVRLASPPIKSPPTRSTCCSARSFTGPTPSLSRITPREHDRRRVHRKRSPSSRAPAAANSSRSTRSPAANSPFDLLDLITPNKKESFQLARIEPDPHAPYPSAQICARLHPASSIYAPPRHHARRRRHAARVKTASASRPVKRIPTAAREVFDVSGAGEHTALAALVLALRADADPWKPAGPFRQRRLGRGRRQDRHRHRRDPAELLAYVSP